MDKTPSDALVFFGATGDLAYKKIFPALQGLVRRRRLTVPIVGVAKAGWTLAHLQDRARASIDEYGGGVKDDDFARLVELLRYVDGDYREPATFDALRQALGPATHPTCYLAIPPSLFGTVTEGLARASLVTGSRVIIEKPFGHDLASAVELNASLRQRFAEDQIYRVDHYLCKETVQNLLAFRFSNGIYEPLWNKNHVDHIQITVAESVAVEGRDESKVHRW